MIPNAAALLCPPVCITLPHALIAVSQETAPEDFPPSVINGAPSGLRSTTVPTPAPFFQHIKASWINHPILSVSSGSSRPTQLMRFPLGLPEFRRILPPKRSSKLYKASARGSMYFRSLAMRVDAILRQAASQLSFFSFHRYRDLITAS